ncbi:MAG: hypothetical protein GX340_00305 [Clostridiales bacterium]|nr:hypothetical protein [Clostridiales bacterium]
MLMQKIVANRYPIAHITDITPVSFRFYQYNYCVLVGNWLFALLAEDGKTIEIYNNMGIMIDVINCLQAVK